MDQQLGDFAQQGQGSSGQGSEGQGSQNPLGQGSEGAGRETDQPQLAGTASGRNAQGQGSEEGYYDPNKTQKTQNRQSGTPQGRRSPGAPPHAAPDGSIGSGYKGSPADKMKTGETPKIPPDLRNVSNDDIVARQLRAAALAETDPDLREKLWEEYRKYKNI